MTTLASAVLTGVAVLLAGSLPWVAVLAPLNLYVGSSVPWAVVPMAAYLWLYWRFLGGGLGNPGSAAMRRERLRANPVSPDAWGLAIVTGLIGFGAVLSLAAVMARLMTMPPQAQIMSGNAPVMTMIVLLTMASLVAGVTEEAAFRGYMQGPIERRYGLVPAVLVNGLVFGLLHFLNHPDAVVPMLPFYLAVAAVYGGLTWATDSILPALALHVGGDIWSLGRLWLTGRPEWQLSVEAPPLIWNAGIDGAFLFSAGLLVVSAAAFGVLCRQLRALAGSRPNYN